MSQSYHPEHLQKSILGQSDSRSGLGEKLSQVSYKQIDFEEKRRESLRLKFEEMREINSSEYTDKRL